MHLKGIKLFNWLMHGNALVPKAQCRQQEEGEEGGKQGLKGVDEGTHGATV